MAELKNELAWSFSRDERLRRCPRKYYYQHYASWGGWDRAAPPLQREIYRLTKLERRATWQGSVVHAVLARALDGARLGRPDPDPEAVVAEAVGWMRQDYADSRDDVARRAGNFKAHVRFLEHELPHDPESPWWRRQWKESAEAVEGCIRRFFASSHWDVLKRLPPDRWVEIEDWSGRGAPASFEVAGVKAFAKVDCAFRDGERVVVVDWKTGRGGRDEAPRQLAAYALYMQQRHRVPAEALVAREVNVAHGTVREHDVSPGVVEAFAEHVRASVERMRAYLADPVANVPLPEAEFPLTNDDAECRRCRFRSICPKTSAAM